MINQEKHGKSYKLVAKTNNGGYSMRLQREGYWQHFKPREKEEYVVFESYKPLHLKNLRRGMKLFLENHWPGFAKDPKYFKSAKAH